MAKPERKIPLIHKTSGNFIRISLVLMLLSTIALYFYVHRILRSEVEEELYSTKARVAEALRKGHKNVGLQPIIAVHNVTRLKPEILKDTIIYDPSQKEMEEFRELISFQEINGQNYRISVRTLVVESGNVLYAVVVMYVIIIIIMFLFLFYFNQKGNARLWQPFFDNLRVMKQFSVVSESKVTTIPSTILEFSELSNEIELLTRKVQSDYHNLKQYTEDVSHELQTPLAIILAKIENLLNDEDLKEAQYQSLTSIQRDMQRLTQLNKRLTLLTKIENNQFLQVKEVDLNVVLEEVIENLSEISPVEISYTCKDVFSVKMDMYLAEILCTNLLSNALKYSFNAQPIEVIIQENKLTVANFGDKPIAHPEKLFTRFYKESKEKKSTGLGLAIVKQICTLYNFTVSYSFTESKHAFTVVFSKVG